MVVKFTRALHTKKVWVSVATTQSVLTDLMSGRLSMWPITGARLKNKIACGNRPLWSVYSVCVCVCTCVCVCEYMCACMCMSLHAYIYVCFCALCVYVNVLVGG